MDIILAQDLVAQGVRLNEIANRFQIELTRLLEEYNETQQGTVLLQRIEAASTYFTNLLELSFLKPVQNHRRSVSGKKKLKKYIKELVVLENFFSDRIEHMKQAQLMVNG